MNTNNLQLRLKQETSELHSKAEQHPLMQSFINGNFKHTHLLRFLVNLLPVYQVVEQRLLGNNIYLYQQFDMKRSGFMQMDIDDIVRDHEWSYPIVFDVTKKWITNSWNKPIELLKADLYVRWLADFYGGRILSKSQAPYNNMYKSDNPSETISIIRSVLDLPVLPETATEDEIVEEAKNFFQYHLDLFDAIYAD
jgi:heme oxygenase